MPAPMRWPLLEPVCTRLADEQGALRKQAATRIALCSPSPYHVGMSSLGFQTIYREIHTHDDAAAERAFLPDDLQAWREARVPLCTYESQQPVAGFSCLAFSVSYELEIAGLFDMLDLAGIPILREERDERHPLIVCGGPLTFSNPVPLAPFADVIVLGEAEELIHTLCDALTLPRHELRTQLSRRPGFYVPELSGSWPGVVKAEDDRLPARSQILTPHTELRSMFLIEPERGCSRGCTYCVMRRTTNGGMRTVDPERLLDLVPEGARRVGLVGAAVTDHPRVVELVRRLVDDGREVGISSLRADRLCARPELVALLAQSGARTLTTAADGAAGPRFAPPAHAGPGWNTCWRRAPKMPASLPWRRGGLAGRSPPGSALSATAGCDPRADGACRTGACDCPASPRGRRSSRCRTECGSVAPKAAWRLWHWTVHSGRCVRGSAPHARAADRLPRPLLRRRRLRGGVPALLPRQGEAGADRPRPARSRAPGWSALRSGCLRRRGERGGGQIGRASC